MILMSTGIVTTENNVVTTMIIVAYSFFKLKFYANMGVIAAEGIDAKITMDFRTKDLSFIKDKITTNSAGINIILTNIL